MKRQLLFQSKIRRGKSSQKRIQARYRAHVHSCLAQTHKQSNKQASNHTSNQTHKQSNMQAIKDTCNQASTLARTQQSKQQTTTFKGLTTKQAHNEHNLLGLIRFQGFQGLKGV